MKESANKSKNKKAPPAGFPMPGVDLDQLERLLDFMASHGLEEFEYEHAGLHIRLRKTASGFSAPQTNTAQSGSPSATQVAAPVASTEHAVDAAPAGAVRAAAPPAEELHVIKSPIVGTFYAAASPDAAPFVKIGDAIEEGKVVCIVEAMKLMNEIEADVSGEVVRVLVENGQPVEYGQPLFAVRAAETKNQTKKK
jgi:acetyl-CoA carboxylase biotin carboxyl carrier protein